MTLFARKKLELPSAETALVGRSTPIPTADSHFVNGRPLQGGVPEGAADIYLGMGCFWGAERLFWTLPGVWVTSVGYQGGITPNPTYQEVCSGQTGHTEIVKVTYLPSEISIDEVLATFWNNHDPTQGMRQGNDRGTQYRSAIYTTTAEQAEAARASAADFAPRLSAAGFGAITTEIGPAETYFYAEDYHQQYLARNPGGYCGIAGTGVTCPIGTKV